jgi:hypothetical protein
LKYWLMLFQPGRYGATCHRIHGARNQRQQGCSTSTVPSSPRRTETDGELLGC